MSTGFLCLSFLMTGKDRLQNICQHYLSCGLTMRQHKSAEKRANNCLPYADIRLIVNFLVNYAEEHAILLPGRVHAYKKFDVQLLPSSITKNVSNTLKTIIVNIIHIHTLFRWFGGSMLCPVQKQDSELLHTPPF